MIQFDPCHGFYFIWRRASEDHRAIGFKIKWARHMLFSEREGYARGFRLGPFYIGTYE